MATTMLQDVLEATGYLAGGEPAHGVLLGAEARRGCRTRQFTPDARWRSDSAVTVHFKYEPDVPADERVAAWRREIWNQGFAPLLWVVSPERIDLYNGFGRPRASGDAAAHRLRTFRTVEHALGGRRRHGDRDARRDENLIPSTLMGEHWAWTSRHPRARMPEIELHHAFLQLQTGDQETDVGEC